MPQPNDLSRSLVALDQNSTIIAVIEMSQSSWLIAGVLPGIERQPRKKLERCAQNHLTGVITGRDIAMRVAAEGCDPKEVTVGQAMTCDALYCFESEPVNTVSQKITECGSDASPW